MTLKRVRRPGVRAAFGIATLSIALGLVRVGPQNGSQSAPIAEPPAETAAPREGTATSTIEERLDRIEALLGGLVGVAAEAPARKDRKLSVLALKNRKADQALSQSIRELFGNPGELQIHFDQRTNSLIVLSDSDQLAKVRKLLALLDVPADGRKQGARQSSFAGEQAGQEWDANGLKMKCVWCPPGIVPMEEIVLIVERRSATEVRPAEGEFVVSVPGSPEGVAREFITKVPSVISRGYWLGKYEVTQREWTLVMESEPWKDRPNVQPADDSPACCMTWEEARTFCQKLTRRERAVGRLPANWEYSLPTEAQWEWGCRANSTTRFSYGDDPAEFGEHAWFIGNAFQNNEPWAHRVGTRRANSWGLHDMHGNVWEWCRDHYSPQLPGGQDPEVTQGRGTHVIRGGGWGNQPIHSSSAYRYFRVPQVREDGLGFRVAVTEISAEGE